MSDQEYMNDAADAADAAEEATQDAAQAARNLFEEFIRHEQKAFEETGLALDALIPPGFKEHGRSAANEFIRGFRVLFDATVDVMAQASKEVEKGLNRATAASDSDDRPSSTGPTKVKVQVE
jgi:hypothetical protein